MEFIVTNKTKLYSDCNLESKVIQDIKENITFISNYPLGPWLNITIDKVNGWLYPFTTTGKSIIKTKEEYKSSEKSKLNSVVSIKPNVGLSNYKDKNGLTFQVKNKKGSTNLFTITKEKDKDNFYTVKNKDNKEYLIHENDILEVKKTIEDYIFYADGDNVSTNTTQQDANSSSESMVSAAATFQISTEHYLDDLINSYKTTSQKNKDNALSDAKIHLDSLASIFGMPYQYLPIADYRASLDDEKNASRLNRVGENEDYSNVVSKDYSIGLKYREKILSRMPLLVMMPGVVNFMPNYSADDKTKMIEQLLKSQEEQDSFGSSSLNVFNRIITKSETRASYYTFFPAWAEYYKYVNTLCRVAAMFMGLDEVKIPNNNHAYKSLSDFSWQNYGDKELQKEAWGFYKGAVCFYLNATNQISESYSNSTTQSQMASKINEVSDLIRELTFISGSTGVMQNLSSKVAGLMGSVGKFGTNMTQQLAANFTGEAGKWRTQGFMQAALDGVKNTMQGAKMIFPELWADSSFSRDYNVEIRLVSPDNDPLSVYLNIIVPLMHLIAFAAPRSTGPTTYASPFLVRAYYQGFFNCNMGIVTSLDISKGEEGAWTYDGIPTIVNVSISIHDLFGTQFMSMNSDASGGFFDLSILNNQPLMEYIANMCGVNYNEPEWTRMVRLASMLFWRKLFDKPQEVWDWFSQSMYRIPSSLYSAYQVGSFLVRPITNAIYRTPEVLSAAKYLSPIYLAGRIVNDISESVTSKEEEIKNTTK